MSDELTDPNQPAHVLTQHEDGSATRNDGVKLQAANQNPWYVMATLFGEQDKDANPFDHNQERAAKNRRAWNGWYCSGLDAKARAERAKAAGLKPEDLAPLKAGKWAEIEKRFAARMEQAGVQDKTPPPPPENIVFSQVNFEKFLNFEKFIFEKNCDFRSAQFSAYADFGSAQFSDYAYFSSAKFKSTTRFDKARFLSEVPQFHATQMYDDTTFTLPKDCQKNWPPVKGTVKLAGKDGPVTVMPATDQKRAYNRLRLFMNKTLQTDEEQFFHRMEMRCKRETEDGAYRWIYAVFEVISDYGNSVLRPAGWLFMLWFIGWISYLHAPKGGIVFGEPALGHAMGWSFANMFPFFGFRGLHFDDENLNGVLQFIGGAQTVVGFVLLFLLFLLGLGLRNRFRLR